jgi:hypothetical protein
LRHTFERKGKIDVVVARFWREVVVEVSRITGNDYDYAQVSTE